EKLQDGRSDVNGTHHRVNHSWGLRSLSRQPEDQRHVRGGVIEKKTVFGLVVFAQRFTMVAQKYDEGVIVKASLLERPQYPPQLLVGVGNLAVIKAARVLAAERLRRIVRAVGIVEVKPGEERLRSAVRKPA